MTSDRPQQGTSKSGSPSPLPAEIEERVYAIWLDGAPGLRDAELARLRAAHPDHAAAIGALASRLAHSDGLLGDVQSAAAVPSPPARIGSYVIREQIGAGGFGVVFRAEQTAPVHRTVALKVLHPGRLHERSVARFEVERQTLATMEHPAIARVYDFGTAPDGRPYFAMELVPGTPITTWCDTNRLDLTARIRLFLRVCAGVHHAHQRGVVHRDIKPSNVLVHEQDGKPVPKIIDFGVAKVLDPDVDVHTTLEGSLIGTLEYMSPEQAAGLDIDTRTDVFALGVLLYELLTGRLHFDRDELRDRGLVDLVKLVAEVEPRRPSAAFVAAADAAEVARRRAASVETVLRHLRNDLDWILLRALANDREQRYGSVSSFAQDLERHLAHEPVTARAPTARYLARKFTRRHRAGVVVAGAMILAVLTAFAGVIWGLVRAQAAGEEAMRQRDEAEVSSYAAHLAAASAALGDSDITELRTQLNAAPEQLRGWEWRYLASRTDDSERVLPTGVGLVHDMAATNDGRHVIVAGEIGGALELWNVDRGQLIARVPGDDGMAPRIATSPDGNRLAVVDHGGRATVRQLPSLEVVLDVAPASNDGGGGVDWSPDGERLAVGDLAGGLKVYDSSSGERLQSFQHPGSGMVVLAFDPAGTRVAGGSREGTIWVWDLSESGAPRELAGHAEEVFAVQFARDGETLFSCAADGTARRWDVDTGDALWSAELGTGRAFDLDLLGDGERVVVSGGYGDSFLGLLEAELGTRLLRLHGHESGVTGIAPLSGGRFATGGMDQSVRVWSASTSQRPTRLDIGRGTGNIAFGPEGKRVVASSWYGRISLWDLDDRTELAHLETGVRSVFVAWDWARSRVLATPGGELVVLGDTDLGPIRDTVADLRACTVAVWPASDSVLVGTWDGDAVLLAAEDLAEVARVRIGRGAVRGAAGPRDDLFAAVDEGGRVIVFRSDGSIVHRLRGAENNYSLAFAPDGARLALDGGGGVVRIVDVETGNSLQEIQTHASGMVWSPDGTRLATGSGDGKVRLIDPERGQILLALRVGVAAAGFPVFDASGQRLAVVTGGLHQSAEAVVWFAPDGAHLRR